MATPKKETPNFFDDNSLDPVETATGYPAGSPKASSKKAPGAAAARPPTGAAIADQKKKAGFYLSVEILDRFNLKFHELKLAGVAIANKSILLEHALSFALDDLDKNTDSQVLQKLRT